MYTRFMSACALVLAVTTLGARPGEQAQGRRTIGIRVAEASGIRRTEFPLRARVALESREAADATGWQLRLADAPVAAQFTIVSRWPDGSARDVDVDFNASLSPGEARSYQLEIGAGAPAAPLRGLAVTEEADSIRVGNVSYSRDADPLMASAAYVRREFIGAFPGARNGLTLVDRDGARHALAGAPNVIVGVSKRGPLVAELVYTADVPVGGGRSASVALTIEMPSSKSWVRMSAAIGDEGHRVREVILETPLATGAFPWLWDVGTEHGSYGALRTAADMMTFQQIVGPQREGSWRIDTGSATERRPYEMSVGRLSGLSGGWGHLVGPDGAVAFGIQGMADARGTYTVTLDGQGQASYSVAPAGESAAHRLTVYQHFVSTPVPIGATTTPTSMLNPPLVTVE